MTSNNNNPDSLPLPPSLSSSLFNVFDSLPGAYRKLFIRVYRWLWFYSLYNQSAVRRGGSLNYYWAVDLLRHQSGLTVAQLCLMSYIYQLTDRGKNYIHSNYIYNGMLLPDISIPSRTTYLCDLKHLGYIKRSTTDPGEPYLQRSHSRQAVFIRLTSSGVALIQRFERDLYDIVLRSSQDDITGVNKKPR